MWEMEFKISVNADKAKITKTFVWNWLASEYTTAVAAVIAAAAVTAAATNDALMPHDMQTSDTCKEIADETYIIVFIINLVGHL